MIEGAASVPRETASSSWHERNGERIQSIDFDFGNGRLQTGEVIDRLLLNIRDKLKVCRDRHAEMLETLDGMSYVAAPPLCEGMARLDDGTRTGFALLMEGTVFDSYGKPLPGAIVDVWHADGNGDYSHFAAGHSPYNLRRRIRTDAEGRYRFRTVMPTSRSAQPDIHYLVSAIEHSPLITSITVSGDSRLHSDRNSSIIAATHHNSHEQAMEYGVEVPFYAAYFDIRLQP